MKLITLLIPVYNEEAVIEIFYRETVKIIDNISNYRFEFLFVNDGSNDRSLDIIKNLQKVDFRVSYIDLSRNFGKEIAMLAGFDHSDGDAVITMDADLQHPPALIPEMLRYWEEGYDDVYTQKRKRMGEGLFKSLTARVFYKLLKCMTRIPVEENAGDFRLLDRRFVDELKKFREKERYTKGIYSFIGFRKKRIVFDLPPRAAGETKWSFIRLCGLAMEGITSFTTAPLKISSFIGVFFALLSFLYMIFVIFKTVFYGETVAGYPTIISLILFIGGIQLISLGIIGEYVGRIFNETKARPLYFVKEASRGEVEVMPKRRRIR